jgi:type I restriction enzyme M protein
LEDDFRERRKGGKTSPEKLAALEEKWKVVDREARETLAKAVTIEDAAYDLKAVNPNRVTKEDKRTPAQLLEFIAAKGLEADATLSKLRTLIAEVK